MKYYLPFIISVPNETVTAHSIGTEGQSNVEHQIVEYFNDSSYSQSFDTGKNCNKNTQNRFSYITFLVSLIYCKFITICKFIIVFSLII